MIYEEIEGKKRVDRSTAKKLFERGERIFVKAVFSDPAESWFHWAIADKKNDAFRSFDHFVNQFEYYNCNANVGRCAAFYV